MSGRSYKKVKKDDKNKKKFKTALKNVATKTNLPKGQNLTDTNFKVKKIVIKDQVKPHDPDELLYRKKLNVAELAARLGHHNSSIKHEALDGLKDLITYHPREVLGSHHIQVLEATVKLVLDETASIRKSASKIVAQILSAVASHKLVPFFASLNSYLLCGLTHIDRGVREDALILMDGCLKHVPELCEKYAFNLLSVCLDLISEKGVGPRTLSLNLDSAQAVTKWRAKVLERILALLDCLLNAHGRSPENSNEFIMVDKTFIPGDINYFPVYTNCIFSLNENNVEINESSDSGSSKSTPIGYAEAIIPLLFGMFLEVHPVEKTAVETGLSTAINEECCKLLCLIVGIMKSLWTLIDQSSVHRQSLGNMSEKFSKPLLQTLVQGRFPYSVSNKVSGRPQKETETQINSSVSLNLGVARLVLLYSPKEQWNYVVPFLKNSFRTTEQFSPSDASVFAECITKICREANCSESEYFFNKAVEISLEGQISVLSSHFFKLLGSTALDTQMSSFHQNPAFAKWLGSLPERVTKSKIHPYQMDIISKIAVRNFSSFSKSLDVSIELILDNIPNVIVGDEDKLQSVQWQMATLLHWVQDWDEELTESLRSAVDNRYWGDRLTKYISEIISIKSDMVCQSKSETTLEFEG